MHGHGSFSDPALGINIQQTPDLVTPVLSALRAYQLGLETPSPAADSFDPAAAERGKSVFNTSGRCASCHIPTMAFTDVNLGILHAPSETGMDPVRASRLKNHAYRTTPLRALTRHAPYFHDGSATTLRAVVEHYNSVLGLGLSRRQMADLVEYLKTL
jgi:cytochrome c peroxidase